jgi:hypothetical protein
VGSTDPPTSSNSQGKEILIPYKNEITTLDAYERLVGEVKKMQSLTSTADLRAAAGLDHDKPGAGGSLQMLEVLGYVHRVSIQKSRCWNPGARDDRRYWDPENGRSKFCGASVPNEVRTYFCPFERIAVLLRHFGKTEIATDAIIEAVHLTENRRERVLGALKTLAVVGLVAHAKFGSQAVTWSWKNAEWSRPFKRDHFGASLKTVSLDESRYSSDGHYVGTRGDNLSKEDLQPDSSD